jgi:hypothetical protein
MLKKRDRCDVRSREHPAPQRVAPRGAAIRVGVAAHVDEAGNRI